jgi:hypothetical protein
VARTGYDFFRLWLKLVIFSTQGRTEEEPEKRRHLPTHATPQTKAVAAAKLRNSTPRSTRTG